jgi:hypothetical protein
MSLTLSTIDPTGTVTGTTTVTMDTSIRLKPSSSNTCSSIISSDLSNIISRYGVTALQNELNKVSSNVNNSAINKNQSWTSYDNGSDYCWNSFNKPIQDYMNIIKSSDIPTLQFILNCIEESKGTPDLAAYEDAKQKLEGAKQRLEMIQHPDENVSYYEGWFPITRPLREPTIFLLFGLGLFLLLVGIVLFIRVKGVEVTIETTPAYEMGTTSIYQTVKGYALLIGAGGIAIGYLIHIYSKK